MMGLVATLLTLSVGVTDSISTDALDVYADEVAKARKSCGPTAVWYCLRRLGHQAALRDVWQEANIGPDGVSLATLLDLFRSRGVSALALVSDTRRLAGLPVPSVLVIDGTHCIVYEGVESDGWTIHYFEPSTGRVRFAPLDVVERSWSGEVIVFEPPPLSVLSFIFVTIIGASVPLLLAAYWPYLHRRRQPTPDLTAPVSPTPSIIDVADASSLKPRAGHSR